jgi:hypothetical protein
LHVRRHTNVTNRPPQPSLRAVMSLVRSARSARSAWCPIVDPARTPHGRSYNHSMWALGAN